MQAYTDIVPPSAVTHCIYAPFLSADANNLIVAKTSLLQIFEVRPLESTNGDGGLDHRVAALRGRSSNLHSGPKAKYLHLIAEFNLSATITDLRTIDLPGNETGGHTLLIAAKGAKISQVVWNPDIFGISTTTIHYFEQDHINLNPFQPDPTLGSNYLTVDPSNRCVALLFGLRSVAIIPFRSQSDDLVGEEDDTVPDAATGSGPTQQSNRTSEASTRSYDKSFHLSLPSLDPSLVHIIDVAFLHEYREPTLGILSASRAPAPGLDERRPDLISYHVYSLDLEKKARTRLISVPGLPNRVYQLKPLPRPIGGALIIGPGEIIHVDQAGKTTASAVNEFAKQNTSFVMTDQSYLELKLEGCTVEQLPGSNGNLLLCLSNGQFAVLGFRRDGRSVSGFALSLIPSEQGGFLMQTSAVCATPIDSTSLFVAGDNSDALLLNCVVKGPQQSRRKSRADLLGIEEDEMSEGDLDDMDDDEDLYNDTSTRANEEGHPNSNGYQDVTLSIMDLLPNFASHRQSTVAELGSVSKDFDDMAGSCLAIPIGNKSSGGLALMSDEILPISSQYLDVLGVKRAWFVNVASKDYVFTSGPEHNARISKIFQFLNGELTFLDTPNLDSESETFQVHSLHDGKRLIQVTKAELRALDPELELAQIIPMIDENTEEEFQIMHTSFLDPYLLVIRNDNSAILFKAAANNDYEEQEDVAILNTKSWTTGCLYRQESAEEPILFLLSTKGALHILDLNHPEGPEAKFESLLYTPPLLTSEPLQRRPLARDEVLEVLVADIGDDKVQSTYLMVRTASNDVNLYRPFHTSAHTSFTENLRWLKTCCFALQENLDFREGPPDHNLAMTFESGRVFVSGNEPAIIFKPSTTCLPSAIRLGREPSQHFVGASTKLAPNRVITVNDKYEARLSGLPNDFLTAGDRWVAKTIPLGHGIDSMCYHGPSRTFVLGASEIEDFELPEDDYHYEWAQEQSALRPRKPEGTIKLISAITYTVIDEYPLESDERALCVKSCEMVVSEKTDDRKELIVVTTGIVRGEDLPCNGCIYVFEVISVVPQPDMPETGRKLKLIVREEVRGAVTAVTELERKGLIVVAQGQKCMVRGLKEDNTLLPVAFMDMPCFIQSLKTVRGTEMMLMADAVKGVWYSGYSEEPYKMSLFGKSDTKLELVAAEFLPFERQLFILATDPDTKLRVLEYNPDRKEDDLTWVKDPDITDPNYSEPESLQGQKLLQKNTFYTGHVAASMSSIITEKPATGVDGEGDIDMDGMDANRSTSKVIITTRTGAIGLVTPIDDVGARRFSAIQTYMYTAADHPGGFNPRAYRAIESSGLGSRGVVDGNILRLWHMLGTQRRHEACNRAGAGAWITKRNLQALSDAKLFDHKTQH